MAPRLRPLLTPPNDGTQKENRLDLRVALKTGAGQPGAAGGGYQGGGAPDVQDGVALRLRCLTSAPMGHFKHLAERRVSGSS